MIYQGHVEQLVGHGYTLPRPTGELGSRYAVFSTLRNSITTHCYGFTNGLDVLALPMVFLE